MGTFATLLAFTGVAACASNEALPPDAAPVTPESTTTSKPATTTTSSGMPSDTHDISPTFFGFNLEDVIVARNAATWRDPVFLAQLKKLSPGVLRLGGTSTMWIDWRTGQFIDRPDLPASFRNHMQNRQGLTLADMAQVMRATGATPIFDLNLVTSTIDDQIAMLHEAEALGMPVRYVELGNELYDVDPKTYADVFPSSADYALAANKWIPQIKHEFPDARIAVSAWDDSNPNTPRLPARVRRWNTRLLNLIHGQDAVVFHTYWNLPQGVIPGTPESVQPSLHAGAERWKAVAQTDLPQLPAGVEAWFTEWNVNAMPYQSLRVPLRQNWAHGLSVAWFALASAADNRVGFSVNHDVLSGGATAAIYNGDRSTERFGFSADGYALGPIFGAFKGASAAGAITVDDPDNVLAVAVRGDRVRVVAVNLSAQPRDITLPRAMRLPAASHTVASDPAVVFDGSESGDHAPVISDGNTTTAKVTLAPYSLTVIG